MEGLILDVGQVVLRLDELLEKRHLTKSRFAREARLQYRQVQAYSEGDMQKVDLVVLAKICHTLNCSVSDVLEYIP